MLLFMKEPVNFGGRIYEAGERATGRLPADFIEVLLKQGVLTDEPPEQEEKLPREEIEPMSVEQLSEHLKQVDDPAEVTRLLQLEQDSGSPRSTAVKLLEKRLKELGNE